MRRTGVALPLRLALAGIALLALAIGRLWPAANLSHDTQITARDNRNLPLPLLTTAGGKTAYALDKVTRAVGGVDALGGKRDVLRLIRQSHPRTASALRDVSPAWFRWKTRQDLAGQVHPHRQRPAILSAQIVYAQAAPHTGIRSGKQEIGMSGEARRVSTMRFARSWRAMGAVYETCGDYSRAAQAYGQAFAEQPDTDMALAAGENAARAGNNGDSLEYYARALAAEPEPISSKPFDTQSNPEPNTEASAKSLPNTKGDLK